ncbi:MAG: 3-isopropylmalate dehydrogenase [Actinomycetota bacterium]
MSRSYRLAVIEGDGSGPDMIREGLKVLSAAEARFGFATEREPFDLGTGRYARTGDVLPDDELEALRKMDAILKGPIGSRFPTDDVPPGILERGLILRLRFELDQYINLRPAKYGEIDFVVVRENTEGLYAGTGGFLKKGTADEVALQTSVNTRKGVERCLRYAFELARSRPRKHLTLVHKTNVLTYAGDLWDRAFAEVGADCPEVERAYMHVDAWCVSVVQDPTRFDTVVTENMFGDIITDLAAGIAGGMGLAASGNINPQGVSMFEQIGGTAPDFADKGEINPLAAIGAVQMMLDHLGEVDAALAVAQAVESTLPRLKGMGGGQMGYSTSEVGDMVAASVTNA